MQDIWNTLAERTQAWSALNRQGLADAVWSDYVSFRFGRTGDPRALEYLYPYLNHARRPTRLEAIDVASRVFEGRGANAIESLGYFTRNPDLFLQDRAVRVVGGAVTGSTVRVILDVLQAYLNHRNQFIRKLALVALGDAAMGSASPPVLDEIQRVAETSGPREDEVDMAIAKVFAGRPTEEVYQLVVRPGLANRIDTNNERAISILVRGAQERWYERAYEDAFKPRLHTQDATWRRHFIQRDGIHGLARASMGRGMVGLERMLHLRGRRCTGHAMIYAAPKCFADAGMEPNREALIGLAADGDVPTQRIAAVCLGRLTMGTEDAETARLLKDLCRAKSSAVQASALKGLGMTAKSSCDEELRDLCLDRARNPETSVAAIDALGMAFLGSGRPDIFDSLSMAEQRYRRLPIRGSRHSKPLAACYGAIGMVYLGTGADDALEFLLDALARPGTPRYDEYHWAAARALVMIEFPESVLGHEFLGIA